MDPMPPDAGDLMYSLHLLMALGRAGVQLTVLTMGRSPIGPRKRSANGIEWAIVPPERDREMGRRLAVRSLFTLLPNVAMQYNTAAFRRELQVQMKRDWNAIIVDHVGMGWVWPAVEAYRRRHPAVVSVFIAHQCEGDVRRTMARNFQGNIVRKIGLMLDAEKAYRLEMRLIRRSNLVSAITAEDLRAFGSSDKVLLLTPGYAGRRAGCCEIDSATPRRVLILGNATWLAKQMNLTEFITAADEMFSQREIELWIVGNVPAHLRTDRRFRATRFLGFVEDLRPIFRSVRMGIVAERTGGGFKLKTLDYIFNRVPIAAIKGGIAGLPLTPDVHFLSFGSMRELANGVAMVIDDLARLNTLQKAAYKECESGFDWSVRGRTLLNAIRKAVTANTASTQGAR
jgi:glycosyltransferase involved in cell wall biosynthesis